MILTPCPYDPITGEQAEMLREKYIASLLFKGKKVSYLATLSY